MIFSGVIQAFSVQTQDLQTVEHVEEDVWLLKLTHLLQETSQQTHEKRERHTNLTELRETCTCRMVYRSLRETGSCRYENFLSALFFNAREQNAFVIRNRKCSALIHKQCDRYWKRAEALTWARTRDLRRGIVAAGVFWRSVCFIRCILWFERKFSLRENQTLLQTLGWFLSNTHDMLKKLFILIILICLCESGRITLHSCKLYYTILHSGIWCDEV